MPNKLLIGALNCGVCVKPTQDTVLRSILILLGRNEEQAVNLDHGYKVVMRLMRNYLQRYHHVYADNFFTSVHLADALLQVDTYLGGTTHATCNKFPKDET